MRLITVFLSLLALGLLPFARALATEGAVGRAITGTQVVSFAGMVPPEPGLSIQLAYLGYSGDIGGDIDVPIAGVSALNLDASFRITSLSGMYVWDKKSGKWNFASMATIPFIHVTARADLQLGPLEGATSDRKGGLFDAFFAPLIAGRHFGEARHLSLSLYVYAPTGDYQTGRLANPSLNNWTFSPTVGYTQLMQGGTLEWSSVAAVDFYTENDDTDYQNGAVWRLDSLLVKRCPNGFGYGLANGWINQLEDDDAIIVERLNGFRGRSLSLGPVLTYDWNWHGKKRAEITARWLHEFEVSNRLEGEPFMVTFSLQL